MKLKKWIRRSAFLLAGLLLLAIVLYFAAQKYAKQKVIAVIEKIVDGPVEVDDVLLGRDQIEVRGIRVYETEGDKTAWLSIDKAVLGLTLNDAIRGETIPESASIQGANIILEYDERRKLLTDFSLWQDGVEIRLNQLDIEDANIEIRQKGRNPLVVKDIDGKIRGVAKDIQIQATIGDALNARWKLDVQVQGDSFATKGELSTDELRFSTDELVKLPFIPEGVDQEFRASGVSPIHLAVEVSGDAPKYHVTLSPKSLNVDIKRAGLAVTNGKGNIVLENGLVTFTDLQGDVAGGRFSGDGELRSQGETWNGQVEGTISEISLGGLPKTWQVPEQVRGTASGQGKLNFEIADSHFEIRGSANATIDDAQLVGIAAKPVKIGIELDKLRKSADEDELTLDGTATVGVEIPDVELAELLKAAEIDSSKFEDLSGRIGFRSELEIPLASAADPKTYHAEGELVSSSIQFRDIPLSDVRGNFEFKDGIASIRNLNTKIAETGHLRASVTIAVQPQGNVASNIDFEQLSVSLMEKLTGESVVKVGGFVSGDCRLNVPIKEWKNPDLWQASGQIKSDAISLDKYRLANVDVSFDVQQGRLAVMSGSADWKGTVISGAGDLRLKAPYSYSFTAAARQFDIEAAVEFAEVDLPIEPSGQVNINAKIAGALEPLSWTADGDISLTNFSVEKLKIESPFVKWQADSRQLKITSAEAKIFGGTVQMAAVVPFDSEVPSKVSGTFSEFDSHFLKQHLPEVPLVVSGMGSGEFTLNGIEKLESATGSLKIRDLAAELNGVHVDDVTVDLSLAKQRIDLKLNAKALGGIVAVTTEAPLKELKRESIVLSTHVSAEGILLSKIWHLIGRNVRVAPPEGLANLQFDLQLAGPELRPTGSGRLALNNVRWGGRQLTSQLITSISLHKDSVILRNMTFDFGGGRISSNVMFRLDELGSGTYFLAAQNVAIRDLLVAFPELARDADGSLDAGFRGRFANLRFDGAGKVQVSSGRVAGIPIRGLETAVDWAYDLPSQRGKADVRLTRAELSQGRTTGEVSIEWGRHITLKGKTKFSNVNLRPIGRATTLVSDQLTGRISGTLSMQGRDVRSLEDISGTYDLLVKDSQLLHLPVLSDLTNATGIGSTSKSFSNTEIKGRMTRGVIHVDRMTMVAASIHMFIEGKLTTRGRLDLEVTADTGQLLAVGVVTGIIRPWEWLRRRLIFLHVGGTIRSPVILPQTEKFVQQEVMLFFLPFVAW